MKKTPNAIAFNFGDKAQLNPGYCLELMDRFDAAQCTIIEGPHKKEAFNLGLKIKEKRPQSTIFYRRIKDDLKDEELPFKVPTAQEVVNYFQDVFEAGFAACVYNESLISPMTKLTDYSKEMISLTAPKGWQTVHFKIAMGNPGGYNGEHLLSPTDLHYRPDGYAESDGLWKAAAAANKPVIDSGLAPLVWLAPHAYFPTSGPMGGVTNRHKEIYRRAASDSLKIDRHYLPLAIGETGIIQTDPLDADAGWDGLIDAATYADVFSLVLVKDFLPYNAIPHLYLVGRGEYGQWGRFDLMNVKPFWDRLETIYNTDIYRLPYWYGPDYLNLSNQPEKPAVLGEGVKINIVTSQAFLNLRQKPDLVAPVLGTVNNGELVVIYPETKRIQGSYTWHYMGRVMRKAGESSFGWLNYPSQLIPVPNPQPDPEPEPPPAPGPAPVEIELRFKFPGVARSDVLNPRAPHNVLSDILMQAASLGNTAPSLEVYEDGEKLER